MKKKLQHFLLRKTVTGLIAVLLLAGAVFAWNMQDSAVYAGADTVTVLDVKDVAYKVESHTDINAYRQNGNLKAPTFTGDGGLEKWIFAGWYTDEECTKSLSGSIVSPMETGNYYAKYVKKEVLSVKCQLKADTNDTSEDTILRCVSSVDSLKYRNIGLELVTPNGTVKKMNGNRVGTKINARNEYELSEFTYSPKAVDVESEYFFSATERISNSDFGKGYLVRPYWITSDGTCVYGVSKYVTVNEGIHRDMIHIPVKMDNAPAEGVAFTANGIAASCVKYDEKGGYAHLEVSEVPAVSVTKYTIADASGEVGTSIYRNMTTVYDGMNADTTWCEDYETESKFVIASSADLYGFAQKVNAGNTFKGKTVYVVSDIEANTADTEYQWARIGGVTSNTNMFAGTFDGQMHTIKKVLMTVTADTVSTYGAGYYGFFGGADDGAVLKNFKLAGGSYNFGAQQQSGSVVGRIFGATLDTVYSDAKISCSGNYIGGLIGQRANSTVDAVVTNCWFNGSVNNTASTNARVVGGLLGVSNYKVIFTDCVNTGNLTVKNATASIGGLVGQAVPGATGRAINIHHCLNAGKISCVEEATTNFGALVGDITNAKDTIVISQTYATNESCTAMVDGGAYSDTTADVKAYARKDLTGFSALSKIPNLFSNGAKNGEQDYHWAVAVGSTPVLKSFASEAGAATMGVDTSWYNADETGYVLKDAADLYGLALLSRETNFEGKTIKLGADITVNSGDAKAWAETAPDFEWVEIGTNTLRFNGTFAGDGHKISGLYLSASEDNKGLFGATAKNATIQNLSLKNSYFTSTKDRIGSIAGRGAGILDTVYSDAIVVGNGANVGGIFGTDVDGGVKMNNCWFDGSVTNNTENATSRATGGLIGTIVNPSIITNCLNTAPVTSEKVTTAASRVGGLIGYVNHEGLSISCCVNAGKVTAGYLTSGYGALVGSCSKTLTNKIKDSYAISGTSEGDELAKGSLSIAIDRTTTKVVSPENAKATNALTNMPALFQYNAGEKNYWSVTADGAPVLTSFADMVECETLGFNTDWYDESKPTYVLQNEADLYGFAAISKTNNFAGKTIKLANDMEVNKGDAANWADTPPAFAWNEIGTSTVWFNGTFDGQGHTIKGLYQNTTAQDKGLFAGMDGDACVSNLRLTNSYFKSTKGRIGSIAGRGTGTFDTIYSDAIVVGNGDNVGGFLGQSRGTTLTLINCWFAGSVTNESAKGQATGGLVGNVTVPTSLADCLNTGIVSAETYNTKATVKDENGTETETTDILPRVGGLIGNVQENISCTVMTSLNTGEVKVGEATGAYGSVIGRVATSNTVTVRDTYATQESCVNTGNAGVTIVYQSEMVGANAQTTLPNLFGNNTRWTTIENGTQPVLISFQEFVKVAEDLSPLQLWLREKSSHTVTLHDPVALSTGAWEATDVRAQGGYTDGHYFYQAYITESGETDSQNKCRILKQDLTGKEVPVFSEELYLGHANDITYDSERQQLVMYTRGNSLMFLNPNTLKEEGTQKLEAGISFNRMAYRADRNCYVVGCPSLPNGNIPFKILNSDFSINAGPFNSNTNTFRLVGQGASCDERYIYLLYYNKSTKTDNVIAVYDWNGTFVTSITLKTSTTSIMKEAENISVVGNTIYVMIGERTSTQKGSYAEHKYVYSFTIE